MLIINTRMKLFVGTPRSGSSYIVKWHAHKHKMHLLGHDFNGEYFDAANLKLIFGVDKIETAKQLDELSSRAIRLIPSDNVTFKIHPGYMSDSTTNLLYQNKIIVIVRKNLLEQLLSYGIANHNQNWVNYKSDSLKLLQDRFVYKYKWFSTIEQEILALRKIMHTHNNIESIIYYENFATKFPAIPGITPIKINNYDLRTYVNRLINSDEFFEWYFSLKKIVNDIL